MILQIDHATTFAYSQPVRDQIGEVRLRPRDEAGQHVHSFRLAIEPATPQSTVNDRFGNTLQCYSVLPPHQRLILTATSVVTTSAAPLIATASLTLFQRHDFSAASQFAPESAQLRAFAQRHAPAGRDAETSALALMRAISTTCAYVRGSTTIATTAEAVLARRRGVCQDFAHLLIALCRSLGVPARYVSGYLFDPAQPPDAVLASHAWAEVFLEDRGWLGLDPTHQRVTGPCYARVAIGRDYADAAPVRGVYQGGAEETLVVQVRMRAGTDAPQTMLLMPTLDNA